MGADIGLTPLLLLESLLGDMLEELLYVLMFF